MAALKPLTKLQASLNYMENSLEFLRLAMVDAVMAAHLAERQVGRARAGVVTERSTPESLLALQSAVAERYQAQRHCMEARQAFKAAQ